MGASASTRPAGTFKLNKRRAFQDNHVLRLVPKRIRWPASQGGPYITSPVGHFLGRDSGGTSPLAR